MSPEPTRSDWSSVSFFLDEDLLGVGMLLEAHQSGIVYPGHRHLPEVPRGTDDDEWMRIVADKGLVAITRDKRTRTRSVEWQAWQQHRVRGFVLSGRKSQSNQNGLQIILRRWNRLLEIAVTRPRGPWRYRLTESALNEQALTEP